MQNESINTLIPGETHGRTPDAGEDDNGINLLKLLHALRRRWWMILLVAAPLSVACAALLWWLIPVRYEAVAELLVKSQEDRLLPSLDARGRGSYTASDYDIFRQTQASLITSAFVLNSVLRDPEIQNLSMLDQDEVPNPIGFLQENIDVDYPNDAEVLRISMQGENREELMKLVDAVTDAYLNETVYSRRKNLQERAQQLRSEYNTIRDEIRVKSESIHTREVQLGALNSSKMHIRHQLELEKLRNLDDARAKLEGRLYEIDLRLALADGIEQQRAEVELPEYLITEELEKDQQYNRLRDELDLAQQQYTSIASAARATSPSVQRAASQAELIAQQMVARRRQLSRRIEQKVFDAATEQDNGAAALANLATERGLLQKRYDQVKQQHEDQLAYVQQLDGYSARLESEREELNYAVRMNQARHAEIEDLKVQLDSPERIRMIQSATIPNSNSQQSKLLQVISSAFVVLGLVAAGFVGWDVVQAPVNSAAHLAEVTSLAVLGKLPALRNIWPRGKKSTGALEASVAEAVAGVRTALMGHGENGPNKTILLTSAVGGEGKTTLASHLAVSFARAGQRVLLIDADTHNPRQHVVFDLENTQGLCDCLRGNATAADSALPTEFGGLRILPAGQWDAASQLALANGAFTKLLTELAGSYDYVLIDAGPVLTNAESLILGRNADAVVLSAMRDLSRSGDVTDAIGRLQAVGVAVAGTVMHAVPVARRR